MTEWTDTQSQTYQVQNAAGKLTLPAKPDSHQPDQLGLVHQVQNATGKFTCWVQNSAGKATLTVEPDSSAGRGRLL